MHETIDLTRRLMEFKTLQTRPAELRACADFIRQYLTDAGATAEVFESNGIPSVLALPEPGYAPVLLMTHFDVVAAPDRLFTPRIKNNRLYGRGALDDKYAAALSMVLLKNHTRSKGAPPPFGVLITGDEEAGGFNGAKKMLERIRADFCIALDGGSPTKIVTREKGLLELKLISRGKTAHGARPWLGENAIEKLIADYQAIGPIFKDQNRPDHWHRTLNFSIVQAGGSVNQVPDRAEATFDIRYTENDDMDKIIEQMRSRISGELEVVLQEPLFEAMPSPHLDRLLAVAADAETGFEHGASDARFLKAYGIPGVIWGAEGEGSQHSEDEHVLIESVLDLYDLLDTYLGEIAP